MAPTVGAHLRARRIAAGLTQRELSERSGVPQPNVSAYEVGRREPSTETALRLDRALRVPTLLQVRASREGLLAAAARRGLHDVRVFGSVARGDAHGDSDVDLVVHPGPQTSLFDLAGFMREAGELLGAPVDVVSDRGTGPTMERILTEAITL